MALQLPLFKGLQRLVLVHGRWSYYRTALVAQYSFYKSFLFCFVQIMYTGFSGYAGTSFFNSLCVAAYNVILSPQIIFFFEDKDVTEATIARFPRSYQLGVTGAHMNYRTMLVWFLRALLQAVVLMVLGLGMVGGTDARWYETSGLYLFSAYMTVQAFTMMFDMRVSVA